MNPYLTTSSERADGLVVGACILLSLGWMLARLAVGGMW